MVGSSRKQFRYKQYYGKMPKDMEPILSEKNSNSKRYMQPNAHYITVHNFTRTWKQPKCPSTEEWIKKMWYIYTMECYSAIKKNAFESVLMRWMKLEPIIQSEVSQKNTNTVY